MHRAGVPAVDVSVIGAKGGHLELKTVLQHDDHAEMRADRDVRGKSVCTVSGRASVAMS